MTTQTQLTLKLILDVTGHEGGSLRLDTTQESSIVQSMMSLYEEGVFIIKDTENNREKHESESVRRKYMKAKVKDMLNSHKAFRDDGQSRPRNTENSQVRGDEQVREMRKLKKLHAGNEEICSKIQVEIDKRLEEIKPKVTINEALIPDSLKNLFL